MRDGSVHRLLHAAAGQPFFGNGVGDDLGVTGGLENSAVVLILLPQGLRIDQIAVVDHGQGSLDVRQSQRLGVFPLALSGGSVADMPHRHGTVEFVQNLLVEHVAHQPDVLVVGQFPVIGHRDAAGLLTPVLEGVQP